jgi:hypothetical protein
MSDWIDSFDRALALLKRAFEPESFSDIIIFALVLIIFIISFSLTFKLIKRKWFSIIKLFGILIIPATFYILLLYIIIPYTQKFPEDKIGVLLPKIPGSQLSEYFGEQDFNEALKIELQLALQDISIEMKLPQLCKMIELRTVSWIACDEKEAQKFKRKYNASAVYWGRITKLKDDAELTLTAHFSYFDYVVNLPDFDRLEFSYTDYSGSYYVIKLSEPNRSLYKFSRIFIKNLLPTIAGKIRYEDKLLYVDIVEKLPSIDSGYKDYDFSPFLLLTTASAFEELDSLEKAMDYYRLSASFLKSYLGRIKNEQAILVISEKEIRRFAAFAKYKEAHFALKFGDKERAKYCYEQAISIPDKEMSDYIKKDPVLREIIKD